MPMPPSLKRYEGEFPMNNSGVLYYNVYKNAEEDNYQKLKDIKMMNEYINNDNRNDMINSQNSFKNDNFNNNKHYNTYGNFMNNKIDENILLNSNNSIPIQNEFNTSSSFSFK